ncbi:MAG TPA: RidA family protein [Vicinamibacterales bacterium]|nr:RidA family protein [Vicinamibacterales bacterium]
MTKVGAALIGFAVGVSMIATSAQATRKFITPRSASNPADAAQPPFSGAVVVGNTAYLSGVLGTGDTAEAAAKTGLAALETSLKGAGMTMDDLVSVQIFCPDVADYDAFNKVYRAMFKGEFPARAFVGSGPLLRGAKFEILGIAVKR